MPLTQIDETDALSLAWRIDVAPARVWRCLTEVDLVSQWLGEVVGGEVGAGRDFSVDHGEGQVCRSTVVAWDEPATLAFTWHFPDEPSSEVSLRLEESGDSTDLRLTHGGLGGLTASYLDGWCVHLSCLEAAAWGTPLPLSMFWRLHGTLAYLRMR